MPDDVPLYEVSSFPLTHYWKKGVFSVLVILFVTFLAQYLLGSIILSIIALLVMAMPVVNFLVPSRYLFFEDRYLIKILLTEKCFYYSDYKLFTLGSDGILPIKKSNKACEYIYIFNSNLKNEIHDFLIARTKNE